MEDSERRIGSNRLTSMVASRRCSSSRPSECLYTDPGSRCEWPMVCLTLSVLSYGDLSFRYGSRYNIDDSRFAAGHAFKKLL